MKRFDKVRALGIVMIGVMASTLVAVTPAAAVEGEECRGGGPEYWLENAWPSPNYVPKLMQNPNKKKRTQIRGWVQFNEVFRWRKGKDQEGKIFSQSYRLRQALKGNGTLLKTTAKQSVAALLNASVPDNEFSWTKHAVIKQFQVYWDGTDDMSKREARRALRKQMKQLNQAACPVV